MARRSRVVVPSITPGSQLPPGAVEDDEDDGFEHPGLAAWKASGDYATLMDASFNEWAWTVYRLHNQDEIAKGRSGQSGLWVTRMTGPLDLFAVQRDYGGGVFEFWGVYEKVLRTKIRVELAGPRKDFAGTATPTPAAAAATGTTDPALLRLLEQQQRQLDQLAARIVAPTAAAPAMTMRDVLEVAREMRGQAPSDSPVAELLSAFREGVELGKLSGGEPQRDKLEIILDRVVPLVERVGGHVLANAAARRRAAAPAGPTASHAAVVDPAAPAAPIADPVVMDAPADGHRMRTAVEVLAAAIAEGEDPLDTADVLERILSPQELGLLKLLSDGDVVAQLRERAGGAFPVLIRPEAEQYTAAVMAALREPPADEVPV